MDYNRQGINRNVYASQFWKGNEDSVMNKKILFFSIIALASFFAGILIFTSTDSESVIIIKNRKHQMPGYAIYTENGDILYVDDIISIKKSILGNTIVNTDSFKVYNPIGIIETPPQESIMSIYNKVLDFLNNDKKVLIIYIDGLGYDLYNKSIEMGYVPYISSMGTAVKALTVYPTITDVTFASMVTGTTPLHTGIKSREKKLLKVHTIFDKAAEIGKTSKVIEGNMQIIIDEVETILNIDENNNGTIDDEIYKRALEEIQDPPDILLVHFHSYDDFAHKYGPSSGKALSQLNVLDSYVKELVERFDGDVIIASDHGMHDDNEVGGLHGAFCEEDLFIPIITMENRI